MKNLCLLLDAARCGLETIRQAQALCKGPQDSLYLLKEDNQHLEGVAPYLFSLEEELKDWYEENGWGQAWGMVVIPSGDFEECRRHFRKFLKVKTEDGKELYFRFYDPRVLKIFLPTCDRSQLLEFFGPVKYFIVEGDKKEETIQFWQENGQLKQQKLSSYG
jgi:hypothetical protein